MTILALKYRPRRLDDIVGQKHIKPILRQMVATKRLPPALLLSGTRGVGKTTTGRIVGAALNCASEQFPCGECSSCKAVFNGTSLDVVEIDAASNGLVDNIRKIKDLLLYEQLGQFRVVLLDEAHSMSKEAFNALLKILEEPPPNTLFILLTTEPGRILDTVVSRSMLFEFRRLSIEDITSRLKFIAEQENIDVEPDLIDEIAFKVQGGLRDAVMLLDQVSRINIRTVEGFRELFGIYNVSRELFSAAVRGDYARGFSIINESFVRTGDASSMVADLVSLSRDLLIDKTTGKEDALAGLVSTPKLIGVMKVLWEMKGRVRHADNDQRAAMEMAFAMITHVLGSVESSPSINGNGHKPVERLTLEQLKVMSGDRASAK